MFPQELENVFKSFFVGTAVLSFALCAKIGSNTEMVKNHHFELNYLTVLPQCRWFVANINGHLDFGEYLFSILLFFFFSSC